jgi:hypothetical protein
MNNQIVHLTPQDNVLSGKIISDTILILCNTNNAPFGVDIPIANSGSTKILTLKNIGINTLTINFKTYSKLYLYDTSILIKTILSGDCINIVNDVVDNKWYIYGNDY